ncbi:ATP-binding cassette domain-containing protein [Sinorhizobium fredii]|uniref:ATP-binding cassette domain-containing protein n=1 Tax=Rhizobium fredii TaxID=380 RepID=UPI0005B3EFFE|nr:ATP-binding cassette domain-containing protein [Sinorhizobium fredii]
MSWRACTSLFVGRLIDAVPRICVNGDRITQGEETRAAAAYRLLPSEVCSERSFGHRYREANVAVLELANISKHFGAIQAVNDVSFTLQAGEVVGLMGDNGAGKSTVVKMIAGNYRPSHGTMRMNGAELVMHRPVEARQHGIEIVYQDLALCDNLSAAANVFLGRELRRGVGPLRILDYKSMYRRAGEIFKELKSETRPRDLVKQMSGGQRQAVAIARTMLSEAKIVLMDEPTAAISVRQVAEVLNLIRQLRDRGIVVVLISHRMPDVFDVADRVIVMRRGRKVADKAIAASSPEEVTGLITGAIEQV